MREKLTVGSLFAGIGGFDLGFERAGFKSIWAVEKEPFCQQVIGTRFPETELFSDVREVGKHNLRAVDCITAGVPCQDVSCAGKRVGLKGERTGLFYEFARILREIRPAWFVFENVPGLLSSNGGRDFAEVLRVLMVECGYGVCWRVLDSQFFNVAQCRERLFIVGYFGAPCPSQVLFEIQNNEPGARDADETLLVQRRGGFGWSIYSGISPTLQAEKFPHTGGPDRVPFVIRTAQTSANGHGVACNITHTIDRANGQAVICAAIDSNGNGIAASLPEGMDGARYGALGNAVTVSVAQWIAERIKEVSA